jgi:4-amino-4-deoxy-L-arabinose transferase-like glycosyltransferase
VFSLFVVIISTNLFSDGMFLDGLLYASISRNMAEGIGSFWKPHLSNTLFNEFYEHPPLALGLQSLWFKLLGDSIYVERFFSLATYIITGFLMALIWKKLTGSVKNGWIPIFLWILIDVVLWSVSNNMLENTMTIFVCLSFLLYLNSFNKTRFLWIIFSGIALSFGVLSKGFFCLYIWGVPLFMWIFLKKTTLNKSVTDTLFLISATIIPILLLYIFIPDAQNNMLSYLNKQVIRSIQNVKTVDSRFTIIIKFLQNIIIPCIIALTTIIICKIKKINTNIITNNLKYTLMFMSIVLSGIIPIMISMKQSGFYILSTYPLFAIGLAYLLYPILIQFIEKIKTNTKGFIIFKVITWGLVITSIGLSFSSLNKISRDKDTITDCKAIIKTIGYNTTINICPEMYSNWGLHGYFSRYGNISLENNQNNISQYYLSDNTCNKEYLKNNYDLVNINTVKYKLYKLKN